MAQSTSPGAGRPAPFVGRQPELEKLGRYLDAALSGEGQVAFVTGDAGSGKSTLLAEFSRRAMEAGSGILAVGGRCAAHMGPGAPYLPFRQILRGLAGEVQPGAGLDSLVPAQERWIQQLLPTLISVLLEEAPDLIDVWVPASLLQERCGDMGPIGEKWRMRLEALSQQRAIAVASGAQSQAALFGQVTQVFRTAAQPQGLILVLDDLHWATLATLDLLFHLGHHLRGSPILILGAYREVPVALGRDGTPHPLHALLHEFQRRFGDVILHLEAEGRRFVDAYLDTEANRLGEPFRQMLAHRTAGHPLFTVELVRSLQERGGLVRDEYGRWIEGSSLEWDRLPSRVEAVIARRVERLPQDWQALLSAASVEGESFTAEVAAEVRARRARETIQVFSGPLSQDHRLVQAEQFMRFGAHTLSRYRFRHNLVQAYLYQRLDPIERAFLHQATGEALEALMQDHGTGPLPPEIGPAVLARHFVAAGLVVKAMHYLQEAARQAVRLSANREAVAHLEEGLQLLQGLDGSPERDGQELALRLALYAPLIALRGYGSPELGRSLARVQELCARAPEAPHVLTACMAVAGHHALRADFAVALREAETALAGAEQQGRMGHAVWAGQVLGYCRLCQGHLAAARQHLAEAQRMDLPHHQAMLAVRGTDPRVVGLVWDAWALWLLGYPDQSQANIGQALALADELDHAHTRALAFQTGGVMLCQMRGVIDALPAWLDAVSLLARRYNLGHLGAEAMTYQGWMSNRSSQGQAAVEAMRDGYAARRATGTRSLATVHLAVLADGCLGAGDLDAAQQALDEAFALVRETGERIVEAELLRLQGRLLLREAAAASPDLFAGRQSGPAVEEAAVCFERAIGVARDQGARSLELRASTDLSRLWQAQGRQQEAHQLLAGIYGWFSEGLDTPDLQQAKALLDELAPRQ